MPELQSWIYIYYFNLIYQNIGAIILILHMLFWFLLPKCRSYNPEITFIILILSTKMSELRSWNCICYFNSSYQNAGAMILILHLLFWFQLPKCRSYDPDIVYAILKSATKMPELSNGNIIMSYLFRLLICLYILWHQLPSHLWDGLN